MTQPIYKTEKRKANVGERILITNADYELSYYQNGGVFTVTNSGTTGVALDFGMISEHHEYEVIIGEHTPAPNLYEMPFDELIALVEDAMKALRTRRLQGRFDTQMESVAELTSEKSDQQKRDEVVAKAKGDVRGLLVSDYGVTPKFIVNVEKRTVVCLRNDEGLGFILGRGIAKCAPNDCFNVHIGKAIALRRALGLEVPTEYLNVPQPTEIRVGDVVRGRTAFCMSTYEETVREIDGGKYKYASDGYDYVDKVNLVIIDDSRTEGGV